MELLVTNLTGPISLATWSGIEYALIVIEVSCCKSVDTLLKSKNQAADELKRIMMLLKCQAGHKMQEICLDSSYKFVNKIIKAFYVHNSIAQQTTVLYTSQQNVITECAIAVYFKMVHSILYSSGRDLHYWEEVFMYAVHIQNIMYISMLKDKVPKYAWTGHKTDVSHLCIFGSIGYANIPKKLRGEKPQEISLKY